MEEWITKEKANRELTTEQSNLPPSVNHSLTPRQTRFLESSTVGSQIASEEYVRRMEVSSSTALRDLQDLSRKGYVNKIAKRRNSSYVIVSRKINR